MSQSREESDYLHYPATAKDPGEPDQSSWRSPSVGDVYERSREDILHDLLQVPLSPQDRCAHYMEKVHSPAQMGSISRCMKDYQGFK